MNDTAKKTMMINSTQSANDILLSLARVKLRQMSKEDKKKLWNEKTGRLEIVEMPSLARVMTMRHQELIALLHQCPASDFFGNGAYKDNMDIMSQTKAR